jgi:hypothetical protein
MTAFEANLIRLAITAFVCLTAASKTQKMFYTGYLGVGTYKIVYATFNIIGVGLALFVGLWGILSII